MGEWVDEWVGGWMDGWVGGWMDGWKNGRMGGWVDEWKREQRYSVHDETPFVRNKVTA